MGNPCFNAINSHRKRSAHPKASTLQSTGTKIKMCICGCHPFLPCVHSKVLIMPKMSNCSFNRFADSPRHTPLYASVIAVNWSFKIVFRSCRAVNVTSTALYPNSAASNCACRISPLLSFATLAAQTGQCHTDPHTCNERYTATLSSPASEGTCIFATPAPHDWKPGAKRHLLIRYG